MRRVLVTSLVVAAAAAATAVHVQNVADALRAELRRCPEGFVPVNAIIVAPGATAADMARMPRCIPDLPLLDELEHVVERALQKSAAGRGNASAPQPPPLALRDPDL